MVKILLILTITISTLFNLAHATNGKEFLDLNNIPLNLKTKIIQKFPQFKENNFNKSDLDNLIRWLVAYENFESVAIIADETETHYKIKLTNPKLIKNIKITGNLTFSESEIRKEFGIQDSSRFEQNLLIEAAERVRNYYKDQGFYNTVVDIELKPLSETEYSVKIKITENTQTKINGVRIATANPSLASDLTSILKNKKSTPYTQFNLIELIKEIRSYLSKNNYYRAELSEPTTQISKDESTADLEFKIEHPEQYSIETNLDLNAPYFKLKEVLGLKNFVSTNPNLAQEFSSRIKAYLLSQGYAHAEVQTEEQDEALPFHHKISIDIKAGPIVRIEKIDFSGRLSKPAKYYVSTLKEQASSIFSDDIFVKDDLDNGIKNLIIDRRNNGYLKAKIISTRTMYNKDRNKVSILINFDEGPLTQIQKIVFDGNNEIPDTELLHILNLKQLEPLKLNQLEDGIAKLKQYYKEHGFLDMTLLNEKEDLVNYNEDNTLALLKFKIFEGPKVTVASIVIEGNTITHDHVILTELEFKPGMILTPSLIEESQARLQRLGIFNSIEIKTLEEHTMVTNRTVLVHVTDRDPGIYNLGIGLTNERTITGRGFAGFAYRNISGEAQVLSFRVDADENFTDVIYPESKLAIGYLTPYIFDTRLKNRFNVAQTIYITDFNVKSASLVRQISTSFEQDITSHILASWDAASYASYQDYSIINDPAYLQSNLNIGTTGFTLDLDYRDHPFNPSRGTLTRITTEYGLPELQSSSFIRYNRTVASFSFYLNPFRKIVWASSLRIGHLQNMMSGGYVPYDKKGFILGGQSTIRGFTAAEAFPNATDGVSDQYSLTTLANMYLIKSELRFPVWNNIGGAIFYDGGSVQIDGLATNVPYRHSAGFSLRYNTPVGPVSFDLGWKLNAMSSRNEGVGAWHLSIGEF